MIHTPGKKQLAADAISSRRNKVKLPACLYTISVDEDFDEEQYGLIDGLMNMAVQVVR